MIDALLAVKWELELLGVAVEGAYWDPNKPSRGSTRTEAICLSHIWRIGSGDQRAFEGVHPDFGTLPPPPRRAFFFFSGERKRKYRC
jgi:hypothetical protein